MLPTPAVYAAGGVFKTECLENGAPGETRTPDHLITNQMLYQLSYKGTVSD